MDTSIKYYMAESIIRVFCGVIFMFQGYDKLFKVKIKGVVQAFHANAVKNRIPDGLLTLVAGFTTFSEFLGGLLLIFGLLKTIALSFLGIDLILVGIAFSMAEPVWDMRHVFPRLMMIFALMIIPAEWEKYTLDRFFNIQF